MNNITNIDAYNYYKKNKQEGSPDLSLSEYRKVINEFNTHLMDKVLEGHEVVLPFRMGTICVLGSVQNIRVDEKGNIKGTRIDWKATKDLWEKDEEHAKKKTLIYHFNEHSDGVRYAFKWVRLNALLTNKYYYTFVPSRQSKRTLAKLIKAGTEYRIK